MESTPETESFVDHEKRSVENESELKPVDGSVNETTDEKIEENKNDEETDEWMDILGSGHLRKRVLVAGEPDSRPQKSDCLKLAYVGKLENGQIVDKVDEIQVNLGDNEVIQGLDFALSLMDKGEEAELLVKSRFGYGDRGREPDVPPGATLIYTVKLLDATPEPAVSSLTCDQRLEVGLRKKDRGNWWYTRDEYTLAINCYRRALEYLDDAEFPDSPSESDMKRLLDERLKTYNNLGAAQIKISGYDAALISFGHVLAAQPDNVKALFRKSTILKEKGDIPEAVKVLQKALSYDPKNVRLQSDLQNLLAAQRRENAKQRDLYKKMMGGNQTENDNRQKKKSSSSSSSSKGKWLFVATAVAVAVTGFVAVRYTKM